MAGRQDGRGVEFLTGLDQPAGSLIRPIPMPAIRILVTGFGPFPGVRVNPTERLMRAVVARLSRGAAFAAAGARLDVRYATARRQVAEAIDRHRPDAVLMLGLAARSRWVRVERYARRSDSALHADASGAGGAGAGATAPCR